jgi:hypothetical protein
MKQEFNYEGSEDQLRVENELLRIKLQAELGAHFGGDTSSLPPEVEHMFLKQIDAFHKHIATQKAVTIREHLGHPEFKPSAKLNPRELKTALNKLTRLMDQRQVRVDFLAEYAPATMYDFIVDELFDCEIDTPLFENQFVCFIYEEFHPNHPYDLRRVTQDFMAGFFQNHICVDPAFYLAKRLYAGKAEPVPVEKLPGLLNRFHEMFESIQSFEYDLKRVEVDEDSKASPEGALLGFTEGIVRYWVRTHDHQEQKIEGPFRLYFQLEYGCWEIFFFEIFGFTWPASALEVD